ncbi:MAG: tRNA (5-methylaminomethyl-2-thiouridine)(34)-methyltransferase MnmD [Bacteroidota bacterium]|nr:tRNA (5-methylaminomethyl-2-thiouridine)(34)-methyltransferase MnmD [Bacteroidota bacterium]
MERKLIITSDGSHSLFVPELNEHYHSTHGAIQESRHVFIDAGYKHLQQKGKRDLAVLEIGMGTGLNVLLTCIEAARDNTQITYTALEAFPLLADFAAQLNYPAELAKETSSESESVRLEIKKASEIFSLIHSCEAGSAIQITNNLTLLKINDSLQNAKLDSCFDLIYFDAFGPAVQPEMWTDDIFEKMFSCLNSRGCLVTYCAKGEVKRVLKRAGFIIESIPGPPGKREMVRALKN